MMIRAIIVLAVGILQASLMAGIAQAQSSNLADEFDSFDEATWSKGDHNLGRSYLDPNNVGASGGNLEVKLPANSLNGGEIRSQGLYGYGSYTARTKLPGTPLRSRAFSFTSPPTTPARSTSRSTTIRRAGSCSARTPAANRPTRRR